MIPKIIHRMWLGPQPQPARYVEFGARLAELHPGWEVRLWTDANLPPLVNQAALDAAPHEAARANILRYELALQIGGIVLDADVEPLRAFDELLDMGTLVVRLRPDMICCAVMASEPGAALLQELVAGIAPRLAHLPTNSAGQQSYESRIATGSFYLTRVVARHPEVTILEPETFYPYSISDRWSNPQVPFDPFDHPDAYAVHWWDHTCLVPQGGDA